MKVVKIQSTVGSGRNKNIGQNKLHENFSLIFGSRSELLAPKSSVLYALTTVLLLIYFDTICNRWSPLICGRLSISSRFSPTEKLYAPSEENTMVRFLVLCFLFPNFHRYTAAECKLNPLCCSPAPVDIFRFFTHSGHCYTCINTLLRFSCVFGFYAFLLTPACKLFSSEFPKVKSYDTNLKRDCDRQKNNSNFNDSRDAVITENARGEVGCTIRVKPYKYVFTTGQKRARERLATIKSLVSSRNAPSTSSDYLEKNI